MKIKWGEVTPAHHGQEVIVAYMKGSIVYPKSKIINVPVLSTADGFERIIPPECDVSFLNPSELKPWPPSAAHHHGFLRTHIRFNHLYKGSIEVFADGQEAQGDRELMKLYDQRKDEWYDWYRVRDYLGHACLPPYRCIFTAMYEVYKLALEEGVDVSIITG